MSRRAVSPASDVQGVVREGTCVERARQQRLGGWHAPFSLLTVAVLYLLGGIAFIIAGLCFLNSDKGVVEKEFDYTDSGENPQTWTVEMDMKQPILVYYKLGDFPQNNRRYINSRDDKQLANVVGGNPSKCEPWIGTLDTSHRLHYPCGLESQSVFNDTFAITYEDDENQEQALDVDSTAERIAWFPDLGSFKNLDPEGVDSENIMNQVRNDMWILNRFPPVVCEQKVFSKSKPYVPVYPATRKEVLPADEKLDRKEPIEVDVTDCKGYLSKSGAPTCNFVREGKPFQCTGDYESRTVKEWGVESGHFIVWMRSNSWRSFMNLFGVIDTDLRAGTKLRVHIADNFPVKGFNGTKSVVLATTSRFGGSNHWLSYGYIFVGVVLLIYSGRRCCALHRGAPNGASERAEPLNARAEGDGNGPG